MRYIKLEFISINNIKALFKSFLAGILCLAFFLYLSVNAFAIDFSIKPIQTFLSPRVNMSLPFFELGFNSLTKEQILSENKFNFIHKGTESDPINIVLIHPRTAWEEKPTRVPLSLMLLASCLRDNDFLSKISKQMQIDDKTDSTMPIPSIKVRILDMQAEDEDFDLTSYLKNIDPDIVGVTAVTPLYNSADKIAEIAAKASPQAIRILGGAHVSGVFNRSAFAVKKLISESSFQIAIIKEGQEPLAKLILTIFNDKSEKIRDIPQIVIKNSKLNITLANKKTIHFNDLPMPSSALDLINLKKYDTMTNPQGEKLGVAGTIISTIGCAENCKFCASHSVHPYRVQLRSAENIFAEIKYCYDNYGMRGFYFVDDQFIVNTKRIVKLGKLIQEERKKRDFNFQFGAYGRVNRINERNAKALKDAGCNIVFLGVESGDKTVLSSMNKRVDLNRVSQSTKILQSNGMLVKHFYMVGMGETWEGIKKTADLITTSKPNLINVAIALPFPGTALDSENIVKLNPGIKLEDYFFNPPPQKITSDDLTVISYTNTMTSEELKLARNLLLDLMSPKKRSQAYLTINELASPLLPIKAPTSKEYSVIANSI